MKIVRVHNLKKTTKEIGTITQYNVIGDWLTMETMEIQHKDSWLTSCSQLVIYKTVEVASY